MIGRADIEESKSNVAMNAWLPQASYPCGNFSDTSSLRFAKAKGSIGHAFAVCIRTGNQNQVSFSPFGRQEISVLFELTLGHLRYRLTDVPPQPNSPPDCVMCVGRCGHFLRVPTASSPRKSGGRRIVPQHTPHHTRSKFTPGVGVFHGRLLTASPLLLHLPGQFTESD
jgi:hypothetical protein